MIAFELCVIVCDIILAIDNFLPHFRIRKSVRGRKDTIALLQWLLFVVKSKAQANHIEFH